MSTVFAIVGQKPTDPNPLPHLGDADRDVAAAAPAPDRSGESAVEKDTAQPASEAWVEWLLVLLTVTLAVAGWARVIGAVFR